MVIVKYIYGETVKGYRIYFPHWNSVELRDFVFIEQNSD